MRIDFSNLLSVRVGEHGLDPRFIREYENKIIDSHRDLVSKRKAGELPFLELPYQDVSRIISLAEEVRSSFDAFVVIGIGGSGLGNVMLQNALNPVFYNELPKEKRGPKFYVLDNVDPEKLSGLLNVIGLERTCFNVISKSGSTSETMANFLIIHNLLREKGVNGPKQIIITTDPEKGDLLAIAKEKGFRTLVVPPGVGGRFSVLTDVGLFPAAVAGLDIKALLQGAGEMDKHTSKELLSENPAYLLAITHYLLNRDKGKSISVLMPYSERLYSFADWYRQLWAESLGKDGKGQTPIKALGTVDQHSQIQLYNSGPNDKIITFLKVEEFASDFTLSNEFPGYKACGYFEGHKLSDILNSAQIGTTTALTKKQRPNMCITLNRITAQNIGKLIYLYEVATAFSGYLYEINPFDQPGVEDGKKAMYALLGREGYAEQADEVRKFASSEDGFVLEV